MGYGGTLRDGGAAIGRSGDEGVDGIIKEDRLGAMMARLFNVFARSGWSGPSSSS
jgi:hypothetical protein